MIFLIMESKLIRKFSINQEFFRLLIIRLLHFIQQKSSLDRFLVKLIEMQNKNYLFVILVFQKHFQQFYIKNFQTL